jgi:hypothetical protein
MSELGKAVDKGGWIETKSEIRKNDDEDKFLQ